jgi:hypothetical protein
VAARSLRRLTGGLAKTDTGNLQGTVFIVNSDTSRSVVAGAEVRLEGFSSSLRIATDSQGTYRFVTLAPDTYRIEVKAPGFTGASGAKIITGM